jgi:tRNA(His) 5'-end guanylyltransferase
MIKLMQEVTMFLVEETNAKIGYTQSDEISLVLYSDNYNSQTYFNGKIQKLVSVIASITTAKFNELKPKYLPEKANRLAYFDCRAWQSPTLEESANNILWREKDATKNAISMAAQHYYSHKELLNKSSKEKQEMLFAKGINFNNYPDCFKRGSFIQRKTISKKFTIDEIDKLPLNHKARTDPNLVIERSTISLIELPSFSSIKNRKEFIFWGMEPEV